MTGHPLLAVENLCKSFSVSTPTGAKAVLRAVDGVSFSIGRGEILGLVGESGCGKTTLGRVVKGLIPATSGEIFYDGKPLDTSDRASMKAYTRRAQMIFQDPYSSLDPRMTVSEIIAEGMRIHNLHPRDRADRVRELLETVGLNGDHAGRFPHEFSGGQRQRVGIARALAVDPEFIVCDEPISALDVSIQAQIVNLLRDLQKEKGLTYLFITHDLSMIRQIADRIAVMYLGSIMEIAPSETLYNRPLHPYTRALLSAVPVADPDVEETRRRILLSGDVAYPVNMGPGCPFCDRCGECGPECRKERPKLLEAGPGHSCACHHVGDTEEN